MTGTYKVGQDVTNYTDGTPVSYEVYDFENGPTCGGCSTFPYDYSIEPYRTDTGVNEYDYWSGPYAKNEVVSWCWYGSSPWQGCQDGTYAIKGYYSQDEAVAGWIVCGTGTGDNDPNSGYVSNGDQLPGTRCGEIQDKGMSAGLRTNICSREGDSGGPLFSEIDGMAYGILHGGTEGAGPCPPTPNKEWSDYSPIDFILSHVRAQTLQLDKHDYDFHLRTTP
jgi:streptogrisin C